MCACTARVKHSSLVHATKVRQQGAFEYHHCFFQAFLSSHIIMKTKLHCPFKTGKSILETNLEKYEVCKSASLKTRIARTLFAVNVLRPYLWKQVYKRLGSYTSHADTVSKMTLSLS